MFAGRPFKPSSHFDLEPRLVHRQTSEQRRLARQAECNSSRDNDVKWRRGLHRAKSGLLRTDRAASPRRYVGSLDRTRLGAARAAAS